MARRSSKSGRRSSKGGRRPTRKRGRSTKQGRGPVLLGSAVAALVVVLGIVALRDGPLPVGEVESSIAVTVPSGQRIRVEVLNVGGVTGMAREATGHLRDAGFDVVDFGNFGNGTSFDPERPSAVVDRVGRADLARAVADALGIDNVLSEPDPNLYVDVSVLLGSDWNPAGPAPDEGGRGGGAWWDPRSWLDR